MAKEFARGGATRSDAFDGIDWQTGYLIAGADGNVVGKLKLDTSDSTIPVLAGQMLPLIWQSPLTSAPAASIIVW